MKNHNVSEQVASGKWGIDLNLELMEMEVLVVIWYGSPSFWIAVLQSNATSYSIVLLSANSFPACSNLINPEMDLKLPGDLSEH